MEIKKFGERDYPEVAEIYKQGIKTGLATFQDEVPTWSDWDRNHLKIGRLAIFDGDKMVGWAALSPVSSRCVYAGVAEVSVYVCSEFRGKGLGKKLLNELIIQSENEGLWTLQSGIFAENLMSIKLHESCGFRQIGYREKIGKKNGVWKDTIIMEKRSKIVGQ
ncbi:GNAT family N-acetyltransferase [Pedobacter rhodius]|uniref:GNAT family N-acetyltransferase n=1 Tax=Pedobacter rhodius TaxID=3004098 RepID=A0ABT4L1Q7_9SPHI|nr:GNAT family N-acetyltransferase [Pedobacter sp. SJ11]MCZ4225059.1 GNAT family N-acetyltransferase [Pedobacter sp. SJ11]